MCVAASSIAASAPHDQTQHADTFCIYSSSVHGGLTGIVVSVSKGFPALRNAGTYV
jgi:hypothetical protein